MIKIRCDSCGWLGRRNADSYTKTNCPRCGRSGEMMLTADNSNKLIELVANNGSALNFLKAAAVTYEERNRIYKDNYKLVGVIYKQLFPNGLTLNTEKDYNRFAILVQIVNKITRYTFNWSSGGHPDSLDDLSIYAAMLRELDTSQ